MALSLIAGSKTRVIRTDQALKSLPIEALVLEEDTGLILSAPSIALPASSPPAIRVMTELYDFVEPRVGQVLQRSSKQTAYRVLLAVVHDFSAPTSLHRESVARAVKEVIARCREWQLKYIAMQPLGAVHGHFTVDEFCELLIDELRGEEQLLDTIWILN